MLIPAAGMAVVNEQGSLLEFFSGHEDGCAYDNWISHRSEGPGNNATYEDRMDWAPPEFDKENNDFGRYQVVDSLNNPDQIMGELGLFVNFPPDAIRKFASSKRKS